MVEPHSEHTPKRFLAGMGGALVAIAVAILVVLAIVTLPDLIAGSV